MMTLRTRGWGRAGLILLFMIVSCVPEPGTPSERRPSSENARIRTGVQNRLANGGWRYDAYPELESLDAGKTITVADLRGPGQINTIHITQMDLHRPPESGMNPTARSTILRIFFDDSALPAVAAPLGDFFADASGQVEHFSTLFIEKAPGSYNSYFVMPFKKSARVTLTNEANHDLVNYSYVEWQSLPEWKGDLGYFHASWNRQSVQITPDTRLKIFHLDGPGHLVGQYWYVRTDEPLYRGFHFVMEANNQIRIDDREEPALNYLGTECAFNLCWGWREVFSGFKMGTNWVKHDAGDTGVSTYRFRDNDAIHFISSLELDLDWTAELRRSPQSRRQLEPIRKRIDEGGGWVDYSTTTYWYSREPSGQDQDLLPVGERQKLLLRRNPPISSSEKGN